MTDNNEIQQMIDKNNEHFARLGKALADIRKTYGLNGHDTWLLRQLKIMRVDAQLSGNDHEADVLTAAIEELGGTL